MADINDFTREVECIYKDERYAVRDNGAVFRYPRDGKRPRKYDNFWTFGKPNIVHGYMEIASVRVHIFPFPPPAYPKARGRSEKYCILGQSPCPVQTG